MCDGVKWDGDDNEASEDNDDDVDDVVVDDDTVIRSEFDLESIKLSRSSKSNIRSAVGLKMRFISLVCTGARIFRNRPWSCIFDKCGDLANTRRRLSIVRWTLNLPVFKLS